MVYYCSRVSGKDSDPHSQSLILIKRKILIYCSKCSYFNKLYLLNIFCDNDKESNRIPVVNELTLYVLIMRVIMSVALLIIISFITCAKIKLEAKLCTYK
jgi:hypothetical protein